MENNNQKENVIKLVDSISTMLNFTVEDKKHLE